MRFLRRIKYFIAAGAAGGVLASLVINVSATSVVEEDPDLFSEQKPKSKWDSNWDRLVNAVFLFLWLVLFAVSKPGGSHTVF